MKVQCKRQFYHLLMAYQEDKEMLEKRTFRLKGGNQTAYKNLFALGINTQSVFCLREEIGYNSGKR